MFVYCHKNQFFLENDFNLFRYTYVEIILVLENYNKKTTTKHQGTDSLVSVVYFSDIIFVIQIFNHHFLQI